MSIRAHRVNVIEYNDEPTFNLWHDEKTFKTIEPFLSEGGDSFELSVEQIDEMIENDEISDEAKAQFIKDKEYVLNKGDNYILYHCY